MFISHLNLNLLRQAPSFETVTILAGPKLLSESRCTDPEALFQVRTGALIAPVELNPWAGASIGAVAAVAAGVDVVVAAADDDKGYAHVIVIKFELFNYREEQ